MCSASLTGALTETSPLTRSILRRISSQPCVRNRRLLSRKNPLAPEILERATRSLAHRGPDDGGNVILRCSEQDPAEIGLGNRRLAILDLSRAGHQPMQDPQSGNWIVYNGEIYNFHEIRKKLEREG